MCVCVSYERSLWTNIPNMWTLPNRLSAAMSEKIPVGAGKSCLVGKKEDLIKAKRTSVSIADRFVVVIYHQGVFYAMDQHCYRKENETSCVCVFPLGDVYHQAFLFLVPYSWNSI